MPENINWLRLDDGKRYIVAFLGKYGWSGVVTTDNHSRAKDYEDAIRKTSDSVTQILDTWGPWHCENCMHDYCYAERACVGCKQIICETCYNEHNGIHFETTDEHPHCCCDECIDATIEENA